MGNAVSLNDITIEDGAVLYTGTGLSDDDLEKIDAAARHAPIVRSGNMSVGVNLLAALTRRAASALGPDFDIEILQNASPHEGRRALRHGAPPWRSGGSRAQRFAQGPFGARP